MNENLPILLIPGLGCTPHLFQPQLAALWRLGPVMVADHTRADSLEAMGRSILASAPSRFHLAGLSMGGYAAFEILRQAPERVARLALLNSSARADLPEQAERRRRLIEMAEVGRLMEVNEVLWPLLVHESRRGDRELRAIADEMLAATGTDAFVRQQQALIARIDFRPHLAAIRNPCLVIVGEGDAITPPKVAQEIADGIPGARLERIADCGHLSTLERPERVTHLLMSWFAA